MVEHADLPKTYITQFPGQLKTQFLWMISSMASIGMASTAVEYRWIRLWKILPDGALSRNWTMHANRPDRGTYHRANIIHSLRRGSLNGMVQPRPQQPW